MILGEKRPAGKKRTIKSITDDLTNGAWNNLDLSRSSKKAIATAGLIIVFGGAFSAYLMLRKK